MTSETLEDVRLAGRRRVLKALALGGTATAVFGRALSALAVGSAVDADMIRQAEWIAGLHLSDGDRELMLADLNETAGGLKALRAFALDNEVPPAVRFVPFEAAPAQGGAQRPWVPSGRPARLPSSDDDLAFATAVELSQLLRRKEISPVELARLSHERIRRLDARLFAVVSQTASMGFEQARAAERALAKGDAGPLAGLPWGAKDLLAVPGYPTTWGSAIFAKQQRTETAAVAERLAAAGGSLMAKTAVGELAWGDVWYGGTTKNPWKLDQGASGSSAGSAAGVAAGYFPFAIGTETWGSLVSPATRCGVTGLRPTFGRVSRHGCMALAWSMDKVGVLARSAEDCALVLGVIHGADPRDPSSVTRPFRWPPPRKPAELRLGVPEKLFEPPADDGTPEHARARAQAAMDRKVLDVLRDQGVQLVPMQLPSRVPVAPLAVILAAEAGAAFDELTRSGRVKEMVRQTADAWPNVLRQGQLVTAVDYLRASRLRTLLMRDLEASLDGLDGFVTPSFGGEVLLMTNLTGHPCVTVPDGFHVDGTPGSVSFVGRLFGETEILQAATAWQAATDFHRRRPMI
jgi:Asp-tRNA(Asn)/Glu-tRNA(Gln) amidotransferase A subunit family amidase